MAHPLLCQRRGLGRNVSIYFSNFPKGNWSTAPDEHSPLLAYQLLGLGEALRFELDLGAVGSYQIAAGGFIGDVTDYID